MNDAILAEGLVKRYKEVTALDGIDLRVPEGSVLALLGPNGAGKTTAVKILTTLIAADSGRAEVAGIDVAADPRGVRRLIGVSGQYAAVDEYLTGFENLEMVGRLYHLGRRASAERARELLVQLRLDDAADRPAKTYSGGMQRRLDLAAALVHSPRVLFLDEPTTGLDPVSRKTIWEEVRELNDEGTTVFLTTQYLEEADQLADNVGIIDSGRIVAEGTPEQLKGEIGNPHVELLVGEGSVTAAEEACRALGKLLPPKDGKRVLLEVEHGAADIPRVVRALDEAGIGVESLELVRPTLDDVFVAKTGYHLEEEESEGEGEATEEPATA